MLSSILTAASAQLASYSDSPTLDAEILLSHVLSCSRSQLRIKTHIDDDQLAAFRALIAERCQLIPIAYLVGQKEFWSLPLVINADVLVPRPDTELLVETALMLITESAAKIADLGTGSGAIALALATERPKWQLNATDISQAALNIAIHNAQLLKLSNIKFTRGFWTDALARDTRLDAIVSNPPYLAANDPHLIDSEISHEPIGALVAENQGLAAYQAISAMAFAFLKPGGYLIFEHGATQAASVQAILRQHAFSDISTRTDLAGLDRVSYGRIGDYSL